MSEAASTPSGNNPLKTILIGVTTTVVGATIVYFLGFHDTKNDEFKKQKEATVEAWRSVTDYINYSNEKFKTIACYSCDPREMKAELIRELDKNINSLQNLSENKNIDEKMHSVIDRIVDEFKDTKPLFNEYYDSVASMKERLPIEEQVTLGSALQQNLFRKKLHIETRDTTDINNFLKDINKKYKLSLSRSDQEKELLFKPEVLIGKWKIECTFEINFKSDGSLIFTQDGVDYAGNWERDEDELTVKLDHGEKFQYRILELYEKMILLYDKSSDSVYGGCPE